MHDARNQSVDWYIKLWKIEWAEGYRKAREKLYLIQKGKGKLILCRIVGKIHKWLRTESKL